MKQLFANNASTTLQLAAASTDLSLTLVSVAGFPIPAANQFFLITLSIGAQIEICSISGVNTVTNVLTVLARGQEGTTAQAFVAGAVAESRITAGTLTNFTNALDPLDSIDSLVAPVNSLANSYITGSLDSSSSPITAITKSSTVWSFLNYSLQFSGSVTTSSTTSIYTSTIPALPISNTNQYLVQFTSGVYSGLVRGVTALFAGQLNWSTPLSGTPAAGTTFEVYEGNSSIANLLSPHTQYGTPISTSVTLLATDSGKMIEVSAGVVTMPAVASGLRYVLIGVGVATGSLAVPAGVTLYYPDGTNVVAGTILLGLGTSILIACNGTAWEILNTSGQVVTKNATASTHAVNLGQANTLYEPLLTYTPVQQGTGVGQSANLVKIGWSAGSRIKATIDAADQGNFAMEGTNNTFTGTNTFTNPITIPAATVAGQGVNLGQLSTSSVANAANLVTAGWVVQEVSGVLFFKYGGVNKAKIDQSGNLTVVGNVTAYGAV